MENGGGRKERERKQAKHRHHSRALVLLPCKVTTTESSPPRTSVADAIQNGVHSANFCLFFGAAAKKQGRVVMAWQRCKDGEEVSRVLQN